MRLRPLWALIPILLAFTIPATADAQIPGLRIGLGGGPAFPLSDLAGETATGVHLRGSVGLEIPLIPLGVRGDVLWQRYPADTNGNFTGLAGLLNATLRLPIPVVRPYLIGGVGFVDYSDPEVPNELPGQPIDEPAEDGTNFAFAAGAGLEIRILRIGGFVEARYMDWGRHRAIPLTIGITF